jgi:cyclophilin family peptidyl-prolyl cis-trans isomerase
MKKLVILLVSLLFVLVTRSAEATEPPFELPERKDILKIRSAILETSKGKLFLELFPEEAPWHVANFKYLADKGFYRNISFHLYKPEYLIQGGDPLGNGKGGPGYSLPAEFSARHHTLGTLGMARVPNTDPKTGRPLNPQRRSHGSQFHILLGDAPHMDGQYTIFGKVVGGLDTLERLRAGDTILKITVFIREGGR